MNASNLATQKIYVNSNNQPKRDSPNAQVKFGMHAEMRACTRCRRQAVVVGAQLAMRAPDTHILCKTKAADDRITYWFAETLGRWSK